MRDLYAILEVDSGASSLGIKRAFRRLALRHHPDRASEDEKEGAEERFKEITRAYAVLGSVSHRRFYDKFGYTEDEPVILSEVLQKFREDIDDVRQSEEIEEKIPHFENIRSMDGKVVATCNDCEGSGVIQKSKGFLLLEERCRSCKGSGYVTMWEKPKKKENSWMEDFFGSFRPSG